MASTLSEQQTRTVRRALHLLDRHLKASSLPLLDHPAAVKNYLRCRFAGLDHEEFHALYLDSQLRLIAAERLSIGCATRADVYPRELARSALRLNASAVLVAHNHPSGNATPSAQDRAVTRQLRAVLHLIDVQLFDHFVVTASEVVSAAEGGEL